MESPSPSRAKRFGLLSVKVTAIFLMLAAVLIPGLTKILVENYFLPELKAQTQDIDAHFKDFKSDLVLLEKFPLFLANTSGADASSSLSPYIPWEGSDEPQSEAEKNFAAVANFLNQHKDWAKNKEVLITATQDLALGTLDMEWMNALLDKSHWSLVAHPAFAATIERVPHLNSLERGGVFAVLPIPRYDALRDWAAVYLMKTAHDGSPRQGLEMFRKVAELIHSNGTLASHMVAANMLKQEAMLAETFAVTDWRAHSIETIEAYRRVSWGWVGLVQGAWINPTPEELVSYMTPQYGICAAAFENVGGLSRMYDYLGRNFLFEPDFSEEIASSQAIDQHLLSVCKMDALQAFSTPTADGTNPFWVKFDQVVLANNPDEGWTYNRTRIPYLRRLIGLQLLTIAYPDYFKLYKQKSS
jgi:hypothetical protein